MLMGFVFVVMGLTLYQERKTERALEALRDLSSPRALVIRDGCINASWMEVVPGDLIVLSEGDRVPADASCSSAPTSLQMSHFSRASLYLFVKSAPMVVGNGPAGRR